MKRCCENVTFELIQPENAKSNTENVINKGDKYFSKAAAKHITIPDG